MRVCMCVFVCVYVEQSAIEAYSLRIGEREGAVGRGSALVSLTRESRCRAKGRTAKSQGMI